MSDKLKRIRGDVKQQFIEDTLGDFYVLERDDADWLIEQAEKVQKLEDINYKLLKKSNQCEVKLIKIRDLLHS